MTEKEALELAVATLFACAGLSPEPDRAKFLQAWEIVAELSARYEQEETK